jgi:hypothetical protein
MNGVRKEVSAETINTTLFEILSSTSEHLFVFRTPGGVNYTEEPQCGLGGMEQFAKDG